MTIKLTQEQEIELIHQYRDELICPKCQADLIHKDYLINRNSLKKFLLGFGVATLAWIIYRII